MMQVSTQDVIVGLIVAVAFCFVLRYVFRSFKSLRKLSNGDGSCGACGCGSSKQSEEESNKVSS